MNILGPAILEDEFLNQVFEITKEPVGITPGLIYLKFEHVQIAMRFIVDLDLDTCTLVKVNEKKIMYDQSHTVRSIPELCTLIKTVLEEHRLV